eukprot:TRINITY_DN17173_c0_g1_i1.p2 TRINITY_DN17173_c0_g1~~TRINITY_DN17173_c0_g1_i1.p2  ORF type:complete len:302 (-),score=59.95 TRINITY_DN17173_c0_g1_i1:211-1026(-)
MHCGPCKCEAPDGICRWSGTCGGTKHPLKTPGAIRQPGFGSTGGKRKSQGSGSVQDESMNALFATYGGQSAASRQGGTTRGGGGFFGQGMQPPRRGIASDLVDSDSLMASGVEDLGDLDKQVRWTAGGWSTMQKSKSDSSMRGRKALQRDDYKEMVRHFPPLAKANKRSAAVFLPWATLQKPDPIPVHEGCREGRHIDRTKHRLKQVQAGLADNLNCLLEPLDAKMMNSYAVKGLRDKAQNRMLMEGVETSQQDIVMNEMMRVLNEAPRAR